MDLKKKKWSHIAKEYVVSIFPNIIMASALHDSLKKSSGSNLKYFAHKYENNSCQYLIKDSDWGYISKNFSKRVLKNPERLEKIISEIKNRCRKSVSYCADVRKQNLMEKSNPELWKYYEKFCDLNEDVYSFGLAIVLLDFHDSTYISDNLSKYLEKKVSGEKYSEYFSILSSPTKRTAAREEEIDLLKIIKKAKNSKKTERYILQNSVVSVNKNLSKINKEVDKLINKHAQNFGWVTYVYEGPALSKNDFIESIREFLKRKENPESKIREIKKGEEKLKSKQSRYLAAIKPDSYHRKLIKLAQEVAFIKAWRREQQSRSYFLIEPLISEIAKRTGYLMKQTRFMLPNEIKNFLLKSQLVAKSELKKRLKLCVIFYEKGSPIKLIVGEKAKNF